MAYSIEITPAAQRQLRKLERHLQRRVARRIEALAEDPRPPGVVKLTDVSPPLYRVREGEYRILYRIHDDKLLVLLVRIGHRSEAYR